MAEVKVATNANTGTNNCEADENLDPVAPKLSGCIEEKKEEHSQHIRYIKGGMSQK